MRYVEAMICQTYMYDKLIVMKRRNEELMTMNISTGYPNIKLEKLGSMTSTTQPQPHADHIVSPNSQHIQYRNIQPIKWPLSSTKFHNRIRSSKDCIGDFKRF